MPNNIFNFCGAVRAMQQKKPAPRHYGAGLIEYYHRLLSSGQCISRRAARIST